MDFDKIIDVHTHLWPDAGGLQANTQQERALLAMADRYNIERMVVMPLFGGLYPTAGHVRAANDAVGALARRQPRVLPFCYVWPPDVLTAGQELKRRMEEEHFAGLKIWVCQADDPCVFPLVEQMIGYDRPILIHALRKAVGQLSGESDPAHVARLARRYPQAKIIMAHVGGDYIFGADAVADCPNVLTDPSGSYCESGMLEYAVRRLGAERILFGSDAPCASLVRNIGKVMGAGLSAAQKRKIMYDNARRVLALA